MKREDLIKNIIKFTNGEIRSNLSKDDWINAKTEVSNKIKCYDAVNINYLSDNELNELALICGLEKIKEDILGLFDPDLEDVSISSHKDFISNKKVDFRVYVSLSAISNREPDSQGSRYIYLDKVDRNLKELSEILGMSVSMLQKHIRALRKMNVEQFVLEEYNGKLIYRLNYADVDGNNFVTVDMEKIPLLLNGLSNNCIKLYTVFLWACRLGERRFTQDWLAEQIGLSKKTKRAIRDNITVLEKCGLIKIRKEYEIKHRMEKGVLVGYREPSYFYSLSKQSEHQ